MNHQASVISMFLLSFCLPFLGAQDLHVHYNAHSKNLTYVFKGDTIHRPKVKQDAQILLHVHNFNNFLYDVEVKSNSTVLGTSANKHSFGGLTPNGPVDFPELLGGVLEPIPFLSTAGLEMPATEGAAGAVEGINVKGMDQLTELKNEYRFTLKELFRSEQAINGIEKSVNTYLESRAISGIVRSELELLKTNPRLQPDQIKQLCLEYLQKVFQTEDARAVSLSYLLEKSDAKQELKSYLKSLEKEEELYQEHAAGLSRLSTTLPFLSNANGDLQLFKKEVLETAEHAKNVLGAMADQKAHLNTLIASARKEDLQNLTALQHEFAAISANDFSESYRTSAEGDEVVLQLTFTEKTALKNAEAGAAFGVPPIRIPVYGNLKINASVGFSFGKFADRPQSYFLRDSIIVAENGDGFVPILTSFFHFYPQSAGQISVGGSLGIGLPAIGAGDQQSISFLIGPSLVIGKGERLVVSGGVLGGKVEKLSKGYHIGDSFPSLIDEIPTKSVYELGYFFGLSFNILQ